MQHSIHSLRRLLHHYNEYCSEHGSLLDLWLWIQHSLLCHLLHVCTGFQYAGTSSSSCTISCTHFSVGQQLWWTSLGCWCHHLTLSTDFTLLQLCTPIPQFLHLWLNLYYLHIFVHYLFMLLFFSIYVYTLSCLHLHSELIGSSAYYQFMMAVF